MTFIVKVVCSKYNVVHVLLYMISRASSDPYNIRVTF